LDAVHVTEGKYSRTLVIRSESNNDEVPQPAIYVRSVCIRYVTYEYVASRDF